MNIAIVGSRDFCDYKKLKDYIDGVVESDTIEITKIISGGARGADTLGEMYARENNIPTTIYKAEWDKYGKSAGFIRNEYIIRDCDICFAFWDGQSHGTKHDIDLCKQQGKKCYICYYKDNSL